MSHAALPNHESYNNRFRNSTSGGDGNPNHPTADHDLSHQLASVSESVDIFGHSSDFGRLSFAHSTDVHNHNVYTASPTATSPWLYERQVSGTYAGDRTFSAGDAGQPQSPGQLPSKPTAPGKPRRLSRQMSADAKRQMFAGTKLGSSEAGRHPNTTSADSGCDDVFVDFNGGDYDVISGRPLRDPTKNKRAGEVIFSTSSTASILPNPYNRFNHRLHSMVWCCSCIYFVFFCCMPAIHYMEQSDVEFNRGNNKRARKYARASTFLFCTGTLIMLSIFALIFFLAIFFTIY